VNLQVEKRNAEFVRGAIENGWANAVHDVSDGGILCAAAEMAFAQGLGFIVDPNVGDLGQIERLFAEDQGRYLLSVASGRTVEFTAYCDEHDVEMDILGMFNNVREGKDWIQFWTNGGVSLSTLRAAHEGWLPKYMSGEG
jgi:phosphoribosylformylglycinamidine synthase